MLLFFCIVNPQRETPAWRARQADSESCGPDGYSSGDCRVATAFLY